MMIVTLEPLFFSILNGFLSSLYLPINKVLGETWPNGAWLIGLTT